MDPILLFLASALSVITAMVHSYFGEKRLIAPLVSSNQGVMANALAKQVIRFAWHWTSALWILVAAYLALAAQGQFVSQLLLFGVGIFHLIAGILDGVLTRGKHIGWAPITLIGVFVLTTFL